MLIIFLIVLITSLYIFVQRHYSQWQNRGLVTDKPVIPFGSMLKVARKEESLGLTIADIYNRFHDKNAVGIYMFFKPAILLRDAALVRQIMTTDFASFHDRGVYVDEKHDPLSSHLFNLKGQTWRSLRTKLAPSFSSGKLKAMFETVDQVADKLRSHLSQHLEDGQAHAVEIKDVATT